MLTKHKFPLKKTQQQTQRIETDEHTFSFNGNNNNEKRWMKREKKVICKIT